MSINSYAALITAATEWLARDQDTTLILRIPDFITLAEAKFNRDLRVRQMEVRSSTVVDTSTDEPEFISLPTDFQSMRRVRLSNLAEKPSLDFLEPLQMDEFRSNTGNVVAQPRYYTIVGSEMELGSTPDSNYTLEMVYRATIPPLNVDNVSNWLLALAPDLYLYAVLLESAPYLKEDARIQTWGLGYKTALDGLNLMGGAKGTAP